jgi:hypothetical protein
MSISESNPPVEDSMTPPKLAALVAHDGDGTSLAKLLSSRVVASFHFVKSLLAQSWNEVKLRMAEDGGLHLGYGEPQLPVPGAVGLIEQGGPHVGEDFQ